MSRSRPDVGLVTPSASDSWLGGYYIVQSLFLASQMLPPAERLRFRDVWWNSGPEGDPFEEVRAFLGRRAIVKMPTSAIGRARRFVTRGLRRTAGAADLFRLASVDVLFPVRPIADAGVPLLFFLPDLQYRRLPSVNDARVSEDFENYFHAQGAAASLIYVSSEDVLRDVRTFSSRPRRKDAAWFFLAASPRRHGGSWIRPR